MESELLIWQVALIALTAGVLIGILGYRLFAPAVKQADRVQSELDEVRDELTRYRAEVDSHFNKTSELVNDLTQDYVKVYQHLAEGVQTLGNSRSFHNLLEQQPGKVVLTVDDDGKARAPVDYAAAEAAAEPAPPAEAAAEAASGEAEQRNPAATDEAGPDRPEAAVPAAAKATDDESGKAATAESGTAAADKGGETAADAGEKRPAADAGEKRPAAEAGPEETAGESKRKA